MFLIAVINKINEMINSESGDMKAKYSNISYIYKLKITFLKQECFEGRFKR